MAFTATADILKRVEAALEFDLLGSTDRSFTANDPNDGLTSLNPTGAVTSVLRYTLDPQMQGFLFVSRERYGITVGYSFNTQQPSNITTGTGATLDHTMPLEVTFFGVTDSATDLIEGQRGFQFDDLTDDIMRIFQGARRDVTNFGGGDIKKVSLEGIQKLDGDPEFPFVGRTHRIDITRDLRDLQQT